MDGTVKKSCATLSRDQLSFIHMISMIRAIHTSLTRGLCKSKTHRPVSNLGNGGSSLKGPPPTHGQLFRFFGMNGNYSGARDEKFEIETMIKP